MSGYVPLQAPWLQGGGGGGNSLGSNLIGLMGEAMKLRQGQQEWNARQQLGNIFAASPDMDTALEKARQDPLVSQFPQFMTELRNQRLLDTQTQQAQLGQANSAREAVQHSVIEAGNDPDALLPAMQRQISSLNYLPKNVQQQMLAHAQTIAENLTHGQDKMSPEDRTADYVKKRAQFLISHGMKPEEALIAGGFPQTSIRDVQGVPTGVRQDPFTGNIQLMGGAGGQAVAPAAAPAAPAAAGLAGDGKPLYDPEAHGGVTFGTTGAGTPILAGPQQKLADRLSEDYGNTGLDAFRAAQQTQASLLQMDSAFDNLAKNGGFLQPGFAGQFRAQTAGAVNTLAQMMGKEPPFDPSKVASAEEFRKETERMALQVTRQYLGGQREAAQTINRIASSVPTIENTYLGGKLIMSGLKASNARIMDERNFQNAWMNDPRHGGNLLGAAEAFNKAHPAEEYAGRALDEFGLRPDGTFKTAEDIGKAFQRGLLTEKQAKDFLKKQHGFGE